MKQALYLYLETTKDSLGTIIGGVTLEQLSPSGNVIQRCIEPMSSRYIRLRIDSNGFVVIEQEASNLTQHSSLRSTSDENSPPNSTDLPTRYWRMTLTLLSVLAILLCGHLLVVRVWGNFEELLNCLLTVSVVTNCYQLFIQRLYSASGRIGRQP